MTCHDVSRVLDAYVDDELDPSQAAALGSHLETCAACRRLVATRRSLGRLIRGLPYYPAPERLRETAAGVRPRRMTASRLLAWAAVVLLIASAGATAMRQLETARATSALADDLTRHHVAAIASDRLVEVRSSDQHTVKPWFQGKLDFSPPVADLAAQGFPLVGGRVDTIGGRSVAALVYTRRAHVIHVFIWPEGDRIARSDARTIRGFQERHWIRAGMSFWVVSELNDREVDEFAGILRSS